MSYFVFIFHSFFLVNKKPPFRGRRFQSRKNHQCSLGTK
nr:MAG TPA: hypothetical protein [Caudoviricetes sp.]